MTGQEILFNIIGGIAIFLLGIKCMSYSLQKTAGDQIRDLLSRYTSNPWLGIFVGILITMLLQTPTGTVIMVIGLINAGLLNLRQGIGIIVGANIGTTITVLIVGIRIEHYALPIITAGVLLLLLVHHKQIQHLGLSIIGFGTLFLGLSIMGSGFQGLILIPRMTDMLLELSGYPVLGIIIGIVFTFLIQSSSAAMGILQGFADGGMLDLEGSLFVLLGTNLGSALIAVIAVIGASLKAKRAVFSHILYNLIGTTLFLLLLSPMYQIVTWLGENSNIRMQIAYAHGLFNLITAIIFVPFIPFIIKLIKKLIQAGYEETDISFKPQYLDSRLLQSPSIALSQAQHEIVRMGNLARDTLMHAGDYFFKKDTRFSDLALKKEKLVNNLDSAITEYMVQIHQNGLTVKESEKATGLLHVVNDLERIGDHAENIVELADYCIQHRLPFSEKALEQLNKMVDTADWVIGRVLYALEHGDRSAAADVLAGEADLDRMELEFRNDHFQRLNVQVCRGNSGAIFLDVLSNLERIGDHSKNIAEYILK